MNHSLRASGGIDVSSMAGFNALASVAGLGLSLGDGDHDPEPDLELDLPWPRPQPWGVPGSVFVLGVPSVFVNWS